MRLVVDANIVISAIVKDSLVRRLMFTPGVELCTPDFLFEELQEHREEIMRKAGLNAQEYEAFIVRLRKLIEVIPERAYRGYIDEARKILDDPDDLAYAACAIALTTNALGIPDKEVVKTAIKDDADPEHTSVIDVDECGIWSNDSHFYRQQGAFLQKFNIQVWQTKDLLALIDASIPKR